MKFMVGFLVKRVNKIIILEDLKCSLLHHFNDEVVVKSITNAGCWLLKGLNIITFIDRRMEKRRKKERKEKREKKKQKSEEKKKRADNYGECRREDASMEGEEGEKVEKEEIKEINAKGEKKKREKRTGCQRKKLKK